MFIRKKWYFVCIYKKKDLNEEKETSTMLKIQKDSLTLMRTGGVQQQQVFVEGKESVSDYITPYGNLKNEGKDTSFGNNYRHEIYYKNRLCFIYK